MSAPFDHREATRQRVAAVKARVAVSAVVGRAVKLVKRGREWSGLCPFHQERSPSFTVVDDKDFAHCFGCGWHGDAVRFVMDHDGVDFPAALARLESDAGLEAESRTRREGARGDAPRGGAGDMIAGVKAAAWVWQAARPARGSGLGEAWLRSRGIDPGGNGFLDVARFLPACPAALWRRWEDPRAVRRSAPALIAPILRVDGGPGERALRLAGVHITFLRADGAGKAAFQPWQDRRTGEWRTPPSRVMWGAAARGAVPVLPAPLTPGADVAAAIAASIDAPGVLVVGEGLESTQSLLGLNPGARMAWATLSLGNLEGVAVKDGPRGALPLWNLRADAQLGRPFTIEHAGRVLIGVDADMKPTQPRWVQERRGDPAVQRALTGLERSAHCAALSASAWRQAGAERVDVVRPPVGTDFNDGAGCFDG